MTAFAERNARIARGGTKGGENGEGDGNETDRQERKEQDREIDRDFVNARKGSRREGQKAVESPKGKENAKNPANEGEEKGFSKELAKETEARSAKGRANGQFLFAGGSLGKHEVGDVGTGDEKKKSGGDKQKNEGGSHIVGHGAAKRLDGNRNHVGVRTILPLETLRDGGEFGARFGNSETIAKTADEAIVVGSPAGSFDKDFVRKPEVGVVGETKAGRRGHG